jgi:hypothetical protein
METPNAIAPAVTLDTRRWPYLLAAASAGASIALFAYRFLALPLLWTSSQSFLFPGFAVGLAFGSRALLQNHKPRRWPAIPLVALAAIAGALVAAGVAFAVSPPLSYVHLKTRNLPGFSIDLPRGESKEKNNTYAAGSIHVIDVGGTGAVVGVDWEPGAKLDHEQLQMVGMALAGSKSPGTITSTTVGGVAVDTLVASTDKGSVRMTVIPCGTRHVIATTAGGRTEKLHERMLATFRCTPDAARENAATQIRIQLDLPGWWKASQEGIQIQITDGQSALIIQPSGVTTGPLKDLLEKAFAAAGGTISVGNLRPDGLVPFALTLGGEHVVGIAKQVMCSSSGTLLMLMTPDTASVDRLAPKLASPRCLAPDEPAQQWPDQPTK